MIPRMHHLALGLLLLVGSACQSVPPTQTGPVPNQKSASPIAAVPTQTPIPAAGAAVSPRSGAAGSPAPSPVAARAVTTVESKGKVVYAEPDSIAPAYFDPQEATQANVPYNFIYLLHDAPLKNQPGRPFAPSLAESYEIAPDFKSATFKLRPGLKFHNGQPITSEDVKFTFEKYRGTNAKLLHDMTEQVETPDARTIRFVFKGPFLDFLTLYGSAASGAGWVVPKAYYEQVGPDGFKKNPIGAGPYKVVRQVAGSELELESFSDYWRGTPSVKTLIIKSIPDDATRVAALQAGEVDFAERIPGQLVETIRRDPNLKLAVTFSTSIQTLEFPGFEQADNPFHDRRVRQAVSLALDRQALSDAETGGLAPIYGNWLSDDRLGAIKIPAPPQDLAKAKQLLAEAGFPEGFDAGPITPVTPQFASAAERVSTQLRSLGIVTRVNTMDLAALFDALRKNQTPARLKGIVYESPGGAGDAAGGIEASATCQGARSPKCIPEIEEKFKQYRASINSQERTRLIEEIQQFLIDNYIMIPIYRTTLFHVQGPRIANDPKEIWGAIPQFPNLGPYENIRLKE